MESITRPHSFMSDCPDILILGVGNILLGDEGVGVHVIRELQKEKLPPNIELMDAGTALFSVLHLLEKRKKIVVIDAAKGGKPPGTIYRILPSRIKSEHNKLLSLHEMGLIECLAAMEAKARPRDMVIIGVEPDSIDWNLQLSRALQQKLPEIVKAVMSEISNHQVRQITK
ncbi:MAG: HyaD/HybD family hydrogenase maturation endopeptidase [bacterium]